MIEDAFLFRKIELFFVLEVIGSLKQSWIEVIIRIFQFFHSIINLGKRGGNGKAPFFAYSEVISHTKKIYHTMNICKIQLIMTFTKNVKKESL